MLFYKNPPEQGEGTECTLPLTQWLRCRRKCAQAHTQNPYTSCLHVALMDWFIRQYTVALVGCSSGQLKLCWPICRNLSCCMYILRAIRVWLALVFLRSLPCSTFPLLCHLPAYPTFSPPLSIFLFKILLWWSSSSSWLDTYVSKSDYGSLDNWMIFTSCIVHISCLALQ